MNKYIVLGAAAFVISIAVGCQNCGYKTAHSSRYESLVGATRLASPQTNCRYNTCSAYNTCNPCNTCNTCDTQMLANNGQFCSNPYAQNGLYGQYAGDNVSASASLLDATQVQAAQSEPPLRWRSVTEEEQQYANASVDPTSAGVASALGNPAFGSPAPAPVVDPRYPNAYNNDAAVGVAEALSRRPSPAPRTAPPYPSYRNDASVGVDSALSRRPSPAPQYPGQYPNQYPGQYPDSSRRASMGVASALTVPGHPLPPQYSNSSPRASAGGYGYSTPGAVSQYPGQYPGQYPNGAAGGRPMYGSQAPTSDSDLRWRRVTEEEQQYYNPSQGAAAAPTNTGYGDDQALTVPVYQGNDSAAPQAPEIDPNALPSLNPQSSTF